MKHFKRIAAVVLALAVVLVMSVMAFADDGEGGLPIDDKGNNVYSVEFFKEINAVGTGKIYAPSVTYSYSVGDAVIIEGSETSTPPQVSVVSSLSFNNSDEVDNGGDFTKTGTININIANATAGVYQYKITESDNGKTAKGITFEGTTYNADRYLVVVVGENEAGDALEVQTVYLFTGDAHEADLKTDGWKVVEGQSYDKYETTTVTVTKVIQGTYADKTHAFPFTITINCDNGSKVTLDNTAYAMRTVTMSKSLANGGSAVITGVPAHASAVVNVTEKNDTNSTYYLSTDGLSTDFTREEMTGGAEKTGQTTVITTTDARTITFTNKLEDISGTGLVLRVAPYAIVVAAGAALVVVSRRRKENAC